MIRLGRVGRFVTYVPFKGLRPIQGCRIDKGTEIGDAVTAAIASRKPRLVEIVVGTE